MLAATLTLHLSQGSWRVRAPAQTRSSRQAARMYIIVLSVAREAPASCAAIIRRNAKQSFSFLGRESSRTERERERDNSTSADNPWRLPERELRERVGKCKRERDSGRDVDRFDASADFGFPDRARHPHAVYLVLYVRECEVD